MATTYYQVNAGSTVGPIAVTPQLSITAAPSVLGGSVTIESAPTQTGPWTTQLTGQTGGCVRTTTNAWVRITAVTSQANAFISDLGGSNVGAVNSMVSINAPMASPNQTTASYLAGFKVPPNYLTSNFRMEIEGTVSVTNSATVKTLNVYANGIAGTALATSPSLASIANYAFETTIAGRGDGVTLVGTGVLASQTSAQGGVGSTTTALPTLTRDYIGQETEFVIGVTKATGTDTAQLESLRVTIYP